MEESDLIRENRTLRLLTANLVDEKSCLEERLAEMTDKVVSMEQECANVRRNAGRVMGTMIPRFCREILKLRQDNAQLKETNKYVTERVNTLEKLKEKVIESNGTVRELLSDNEVLSQKNRFLQKTIEVSLKIHYGNDHAIKINRKIEEALDEIGKDSEGSALKSKQNLLDTDAGPSSSKKPKYSDFEIDQATQEVSVSSTSNEQLHPEKPK